MEFKIIFCDNRREITDCSRIYINFRVRSLWLTRMVMVSGHWEWFNFVRDRSEERRGAW